MIYYRGEHSHGTPSTSRMREVRKAGQGPALPSPGARGWNSDSDDDMMMRVALPVRQAPFWVHFPY